MCQTKSKTKATLRHIANLANVSTATVSLVVNNKKGVSPLTRKRILALLAENDYPVHTESDAPAQPPTFAFIKYATHGMVVDENQGFVLSIMEHIENFCAENNIHFVLKTANVHNLEAVLSSTEADGLFILGTELSETQMALLRRLETPFVVVDNRCFFEKFHSIVMDNETIVYEALNYLYSLGHRKIGYIRSNTSISNFEERSKSFYVSAKKLGFEIEGVFSVTPTLNGAYRDMREALLSNQEGVPGAFFADNDTIALGAIKALQEAGYNVPGDISIIGIDDIPYSSISSPPLTTIRISRKALGRSAGFVLVQLVNALEVAMPSCVLTGGELVVRESTQRVESA